MFSTRVVGDCSRRFITSLAQPLTAAMILTAWLLHRWDQTGSIGPRPTQMGKASCTHLNSISARKANICDTHIILHWRWWGWGREDGWVLTSQFKSHLYKLQIHKISPLSWFWDMFIVSTSSKFGFPFALP